MYKASAIYIQRTWYVFIMFTKTLFLPVFAGWWTHFTWPNTVYLRCILVLSVNLGLRLSCALVHSNTRPPFQVLSAFHFCSWRATVLTPLILFDFIARIIFGEEKIIKILTVKFTPSFCYCPLCITKYHLQHRISDKLRLYSFLN
jgi:hypothetical protein